MSVWKGVFLTGSASEENLLPLVNLLDEKELNTSNKLLKTNFAKFQPWMSLYKDKEFQVFSELNRSNSLSEKIEDLDCIKRRIKLFHLPGTQDSNLNIKKIYKDDLGKLIISINSERISSFYAEIDDLKRILFELNDSWVHRYHSLIEELILREAASDYTPRKNGTGLSTHLYRKGVFLTNPDPSNHNKIELMLNLVHEIGHQALITIQGFDSILKDNYSKSVYSTIRKVERPAILSFHALVAVMFMVELILDIEMCYEEEKLCSPEYFKIRCRDLEKELDEGIQTTREEDLSQVGKTILKEAVALSAQFKLRNLSISCEE